LTPSGRCSCLAFCHSTPALIISNLSGMMPLATLMTCPLDRIKTLLITNGEAYGGSVVSCAAKILRDKGIGGFATGLVPSVAYIAPSVALFFVTYEACPQKLKHWS
jgi:hypothetical protein